MEDSHEQFRNLAQIKRDADDYHVGISPEVERIARFFWWIVGGLLAGAIAVTIWVTNINSSILGFERRITSNETYRETTRARFIADDLTHVQTNQQISYIQDTIKEWKEKMKQLDDMWQMKIRGESFKESFFREHGYLPPSTIDPSPSPRK